MNADTLLAMNDMQLRAWASQISPSQREAALSALNSNHAAKDDAYVINNVGAPSANAKATRPLNSFIAFRCELILLPTHASCKSDSFKAYYSPIFVKYTQKDISGLMKTLWKTDPYQGKWSVMAKTYSIIRDKQGKDKTPLSQFLAINAPKLAIVTPENYLTHFGWRLVADAGVVVLDRVSMPVNDADAGTVISVNDLIQHSNEQGLLACEVEDVLQGPKSAFLALTGPVQLQTIRAPIAPVTR